MKIEQRNDDGSYHRWDLEHYKNVRAANGWDVPKDHPEVNHPFLGKKFQRGDDYVVFTKTVKHWYGGYYYFGVYEVNDSGSHGTAFIENINCINEIILDAIEDFKKEYQQIEP
jgi:hypothetical protein